MKDIFLLEEERWIQMLNICLYYVPLNGQKKAFYSRNVSLPWGFLRRRKAHIWSPRCSSERFSLPSQNLLAPVSGTGRYGCHLDQQRHVNADQYVSNTSAHGCFICKDANVRNLEAGAACRTHFKLTHIRLTTCVDVCGLIYHSPLVLIEEVSPLMYKDGS